MSKSILVPMIQGYLEYHRGFDQPYHRQFVLNESNRIATKIRDTLGRGTFDESSEQTCAWVICAMMEKPEYLSTKAGTRQSPQAERERWEAKVLAEAKARQERDERLRAWFSS